MFSGVCGKWRFFGWRQVQGDFRISGTQPDFPRWTGRATRDTRNNRQDLCRSNFSKGGQMKKLMILAVAMAAATMGGKAEAALRLTLTETANPANQAVYYDSSNLGVFIVSFLDITASVSVNSTNLPGTATIGTLAQGYRVLASKAGAWRDFSSQLDVINAVGGVGSGLVSAMDLGAVNGAGLASFFNPVGSNMVFSSDPSADQNLAVNSGILHGHTTIGVTGVPGGPQIINNAPYSWPIGNDVGVVQAIPGTIASYTMSNKLDFVGVNTSTSLSDVNVGIASSVMAKHVVPEPTSMALAGFAGIGMAVGAIRRRRQAKQAA